MKRHLLRPTLLCLALAGSAALAAAQGARNDKAARQTATADQTSRTSADEEFDLNIPERQITKQDFEASTSVAIGGQQQPGLSLRVGVGVSAGEIEVFMRNVRGHVRFRASLEQVLARLRAPTQSRSP